MAMLLTSGVVFSRALKKSWSRYQKLDANQRRVSTRLNCFCYESFGFDNRLCKARFQLPTTKYWCRLGNWNHIPSQHSTPPWSVRRQWAARYLLPLNAFWINLSPGIGSTVFVLQVLSWISLDFCPPLCSAGSSFMVFDITYVYIYIHILYSYNILYIYTYYIMYTAYTGSKD